MVQWIKTHSFSQAAVENGIQRYKNLWD